MRNLILFVPPEFAFLAIACAGLALMIGARRLAGMLFAFGVALVVLPPLLAPLFDVLPLWVLVTLVVFMIMGMTRAFLALLIGERSTDHMVGILAADVVRFAFLAPLRLLGWLLRGMFGLFRQRR